ncbi:MAG: sugar transferase [Enhydrobacter sp.]|nr:sugar transferase [Enhydrobacter sp.]
MFETVFWGSAGAALYHHFVYPALLQRLGQRPTAAAPEVDTGFAPSVTIIVAAYQEERFIGDKVRNLLALAYPRERLQVRIVCDGCTDRTADVARAAIAAGALDGLDIAIIEHPHNRGKVAVLNEAIAASAGDLVLLSDASAEMEPDHLLRMVVHFADPRVAVAGGRYVLGVPGSEGERAYWAYQTEIKRCEAAVGAPMGLHGAGYLFRRALWRPLPADTINDDFILPMQIVAGGYRGIYNSGVPVFERERTRPTQEFGRRVRISAGNMQQALRLLGLAHPARPGLAFVFVSGKFLRAFMPFLLLAALASSVALGAAGNEFFAAAALLQVAGYGVAATVMATRAAPWPRPLRWGAYLVEGHWAGLIGASRYLLGLERRPWQRAASFSRGREDFVPRSIRIAKRALDLAVASLVFVLFAITFPLIGLAIRLDSKGPLFYRQLRVGEATPRFTRLFHMIKYRTMRVDAEARSGAMWATENDPRVTRVGRILRKTRLDELPQCLNVLAGDMSIVGPRPERPSFFKTLETAIPFYAERTFGIRPGISGLAQVNQGYDTSIEDVRSKVLHDHAYAMRLTTPLGWMKADLSIMFRTAWVMIAGRGQ